MEINGETYGRVSSRSCLRQSPESTYVYSVQLEGFVDLGGCIILKKNSEFGRSEKYSERDFYTMLDSMQGEEIPRVLRTSILYSDGNRADGIAEPN